MGTLTADCPRLDSHCPHKLATSCRLTATPNCCACADNRTHSSAYRVYIDGVGFVQRGTRWQSYCWFCKEFWNNRLAATDPPLEVSQTRIPHIPDQTEFIERWFEFHQGYRIVRRLDGAEQRIAVIGEPLKDVSPGFLPRTLDQLRAGRENDARRSENRFRRRRLTSEEQRPEEEAHESIEDALDRLLEEESEEEEEEEQNTVTPRRRESQPLGQSEVLAQRARERFARVFGTREEVEQDDYVSPLASMYGRAYQRFREAEERRASGDTIAPALESLSVNERREIEQQILWGVMQDSRRALDEDPNNSSSVNFPDLPELESREITNISGSTPSTRVPPSDSMTTTSPSSSTVPPSELRISIERMNNELLRIRQITDAVSGGRLAALARRSQSPRRELDMDKQNRPPPLDDKQMTKTLSCQICYSQLADIAVLPCGHMIMCEWCADTVMPVKHSHIPISPSKCPLCKSSVKQRYKIRM